MLWVIDVKTKSAQMQWEVKASLSFTYKDTQVNCINFNFGLKTFLLRISLIVLQHRFCFVCSSSEKFC